MTPIDWNTSLGKAMHKFMHQVPYEAEVDTDTFVKWMNDALKPHHATYTREVGSEMHITKGNLMYYTVEHFLKFDSPEDEIRFILTWS